MVAGELMQAVYEAPTPSSPSLPVLLRPLSSVITPFSEPWRHSVFQSWTDVQSQINSEKTHLPLWKMINYFLETEGMRTLVDKNVLNSILEEVKLNLFPLLPDSAMIKECGATVKRIADSDPSNSKFLGNLPLYLRQQAAHLLETRTPENPLEQSAQAVLMQIGKLALNADHFLPIDVAEFGKVKKNLQDTVRSHLEKLEGWKKVVYKETRDEVGTITFTIHKGAEMFFSGFQIPIFPEGLKDVSAQLQADFTAPEAIAYQIQIPTFHPAGNADWTVVGLTGGPIDAQGAPIAYNVKYFFSPSIETNPSLEMLERREALANVATDQAQAIIYGVDGIVHIPNTARHTSDWYRQPVNLPKLADDLPVMSYLSPLTRYLKRFFFMQGLPNGFEPRFASKNPDIFNNEGATNLVIQIKKQHEAGMHISPSEQLEYYADIILMAHRDPIYFMTTFADLFKDCLVQGNCLHPCIDNDANAPLSYTLPYSEIAFPRLAHTRYEIDWYDRPSALEAILSVAKSNGFEPSCDGLSIMAQFIELMEPGIPSR